MKKRVKIGIIGFGNMGSALGHALRCESRWRISVYDKDLRKTQKLKGFSIAESHKALIKSAEAVIIAIKPQDLLSFLDKTKDTFLKYRPIIISIAAGVPTKFFEKYLKGLGVARVMPNLAVRKRLAVSFIARGKFLSEKKLSATEKIFNYLGNSYRVKEKFLDKATAISGSGPGYLYYFMDCLYQSAVKFGFRKSTAKEAVIGTFSGAIALLRGQNDDFMGWVRKVASKGGTTQAALKVLEKGRMRHLVARAVEAAYRRAKKLEIKG